MRDWTAHITKVEPIDVRKGEGFIDGLDEDGNHVGHYGPIEYSVYPESPVGQVIKKQRLKNKVDIRMAAMKVGIGAVEWSNVERGAMMPSAELAIRMYEAVTP